VEGLHVIGGLLSNISINCVLNCFLHYYLSVYFHGFFVCDLFVYFYCYSS
jgi:hypothetical protein